MRFHSILITVFCIVCAAALLVTASQRLDTINQVRQELGLVMTAPNSDASFQEAQPALAFATVAMGAFRGLVVDILWMRADRLKEQGQFFDAKQLAEWITTLQPRFAAVWDFQAWNMAYNISVAMPAEQWEERWRWVRNGYELLRDKGIPQNPHSIILYRSLAWIFQHKIGGVSDDCHKHYKRELALAMRSVLMELGREEPLSQQDFLDMKNAPQTLRQALQDPGVSKLVTGLRQADEKFLDTKELPGNYISLRQVPTRFDPQADEVINSFRDTDALKQFDIFARTWLLRNKWKLDPAFMYQMNENYGPFDPEDPNNRDPLNWEHPDSHAIYWASKGLEIAGREGVYSVDEKNTDRIVFHSLQKLYRMGKIIIYPVSDGPPSVFLRPDLRMFDSCNRLWNEKISKYMALENSNPKAVRGGHKNMLENAALLFYHAGHKKKSAEIYAELREKYKYDDYNVPLLVFVQKRLRAEIEDIEIHDARELILMAIREAYFQYAIGDDDAAFNGENYARQIYDMYIAIFGDLTVRRIDLPSFSMLKYLGFSGFLNDPYYPKNLRQNLINRIRVEKPEALDEMEKQFQRLKKNIEEAQKNSLSSTGLNY